MGFKKGISGNPNGRPKGSINRNKAVLEMFVSVSVEKHFEKFDEELDKLTGDKFIKVFLKLIGMLHYNKPDIVANQRIIELLNNKIKNHGTNK